LKKIDNLREEEEFHFLDLLECIKAHLEFFRAFLAANNKDNLVINKDFKDGEEDHFDSEREKESLNGR